MIAKSLDRLIEYLLEEIALGGDEGVTFRHIVGYVRRFYAQPDTSTLSSPPSTVTFKIDQPFLDRLWQWLARQDDILVGNGDSYKHQTYQQIEAQYPGITEVIVNDNARPLTTNGDQVDGPSSSSDINYSFEVNEATDGPRFTASVERICYAICGHGPDPTKVFPSEYALLCAIAATRHNGILQGEAGRRTGQDKRSVPKRTDVLQQKGYIVKRTVWTGGHKTSRLFLRRFADKEVAASADSQKEYCLRDLALQTFSALKDHTFTTQDELSTNLSIIDSAKKRVLSRVVRHFVQKKCLKKVRVAHGPGADASDLKICIQVLRDPSDDDFRQDQSCALDLNMPVEDAVALARKDLADANAVEPEDDWQERDQSMLGAQSDSTSTARPQWNPDRAFSNSLFDIAHNTGNEGLTNNVARRTFTGLTVRRPVESMLTRLSHGSLKAQPSSVRDLSIIRTWEVYGSVGRFVHRTFSTYESLARRGQADWASVVGGKDLGKQLDRNESKDALAALERDRWGFIKRQKPKGLLRTSQVDLQDVANATNALPLPTGANDPIIFEDDTGHMSLNWKAADDRGPIPSRAAASRRPGKTPKPKKSPKKNPGRVPGSGRPRKFARGTEKFWRETFLTKFREDNPSASTSSSAGLMSNPACLEMYQNRPAELDDMVLKAIEFNLPTPALPKDLNQDWIDHMKKFFARQATGVYFAPTGMWNVSRLRRACIVVFRSNRLREVDFGQKPKAPAVLFLTSSAAHTLRPPNDQWLAASMVAEKHLRAAVHGSTQLPPTANTFVEGASSLELVSQHEDGLSSTSDPFVGRIFSPTVDAQNGNNLEDMQQQVSETGTKNTNDHKQRRSDLSVGDAPDASEIAPPPERQQNVVHKQDTLVTAIVQQEIEQQTTRAMKFIDSRLHEPTQTAVQNSQAMAKPSNSFVQDSRSEASEIAEASQTSQADSTVEFRDLPRSEQYPLLEKSMPSQVPHAQTHETEHAHPLLTYNPFGKTVSTANATITPGRTASSMIDEGRRRKGSSAESDTTGSLHTNRGSDSETPRLHSQRILRQEESPLPGVLSGHAYVESGHRIDLEVPVPKINEQQNHFSRSPRARRSGSPPALNTKSNSPAATLHSPRTRLLIGRDAAGYYRTFIMELIHLCGGLVPYGPPMLKRAMKVKCIEAFVDPEPNIKLIKSGINLLEKANKIKLMHFAYQRKGFNYTKAIVALPHFKPEDSQFRAVQAKITSLPYEEDYIPPELQAEMDRQPSNVARRDPNIEPNAAPLSATTPKSKRKQKTLRQRSEDSTALIARRLSFTPPAPEPSQNVGFLTLKVPKIATIWTDTPFTTHYFELPAEPLRFNTDANTAAAQTASPTPVSQRRSGVRIPRSSTKFNRNTGKIQWRVPKTTALPKSLRAILAQDRSGPPERGPADDDNPGLSAFERNVDFVADWEQKKMADLQEQKPGMWNFINHFTPEKDFTRVPREAGLVFRMVDFVDDQEVETEPPEIKSWPIFTEANAAKQKKAAASQRRKHQLEDIDADGDHEFSDSDAVAPVRKRARRAPKTKGASRKRKSSTIEGPGKQKRARFEPRGIGMRHLPREQAHKLGVVFALVKVLAGGLDRYVDFGLVKRLIPEESESLLRERWKVLSHYYNNDMDALIGDLQIKYLDALADGKVPTVNFDDYDTTDWEGITEWALKSINTKNKDLFLELPPSREELLTLNKVEITDSNNVRNLWNQSLHFTQAMKEEAWSSAVFGTVPVISSGAATNCIVPSCVAEEDERDVRTARARSWVLATVLTPQQAFDAHRTHRKLLNLTDNEEDTEQLLNAVTKRMQSDKIIMRTDGEAATAPDGSTLSDTRGWRICSRYFDKFESNRTITAKMFRDACQYKIEILDSAIARDETILLPKEADMEDGEIMAILNLVSMGMLKIRPGHDVPASRYGLDWENEGYKTRSMDKNILSFSICLEATSAYIVGDPVSTTRGKVSVPRGGIDQSDGLGLIPVWFDINHDFQPAIWEMVVAAVIGLISTRPGVLNIEILRTLGWVLSQHDLELILQYLLDCTVLQRTFDGWETTSWWWLTLGVGHSGGTVWKAGPEGA